MTETLSNTKYLTGSGGSKFSFAKYPSVMIYKNSTGKEWYEHLLFGDYITITDTRIENGRVKARGRGSNGWVEVGKLQTEKVLEVNFVDIGQGDGCHVVTPDDQHLLIDAGEYDNMNRYLWWRFYLYNKRAPLPFKFKAVISHSDKDHYGGFEHIFENEKVRFSKVYHNGIVERPGEKHAFGKKENNFITTLVTNTAEMKQIITNPEKRTGSKSTYPKVLHKALKYNRDLDFVMVSRDDQYLEDFGHDNRINGKPLTIELLGPVTEELKGKKVLRFFSDAGKSKNGHSVMMKLTYGKATILLGGDLNKEAGEFLVDHFKKQGQIEKFRVDVAKACHHGSPHFFYEFINCVNAAATVISSGDDESYCHPRPNAIGALGKCGYGETPLIFSTELARSNKEINRKSLKTLDKLFEKVDELEREVKELNIKKKAATPKELIKIEEAVEQKSKERRGNNKKINSYLTKYGMINLRTDGEHMILAQKLEKKAASGKWDIHKLEYSEAENRFVQV